MSPDQFKEILNATEPDICKQSTKMGVELTVPVKRRALSSDFWLLVRVFDPFIFNLGSADLQYLTL